ncbi:unnamed protein product [Bursaphelenchus okinawaensis]|uniref:F-box domain-containing protein n=1 Tax=Bursaphelenchus okinawaensis TaxID=465554 RepID=A0A811K9A8_9BILA|nr:unnamed protein product [Bursaphelenchus okinawaensis]CAG9095616.1 unnamed protein product [Bursaphelenchus okinawaensis]
MVRSLFDICLTTICRHRLAEGISYLPAESKEKLLEYFTSHDMLSTPNCMQVLTAGFSIDIECLTFYLSEDVTDDLLRTIVKSCTSLKEISIIDCPNVTDQGILDITLNQPDLYSVELRYLRNLSSNGLKNIKSRYLDVVDLSGCSRITSEGIFDLVYNNRSIKKLNLSNCRDLDDQALYDIAYCIGENLETIELDCLPNMLDPATTLHDLSHKCPNISQLSLCRFFGAERENDVLSEYEIAGSVLREIDLYGNYFVHLPKLPPTIKTIRLSVTGCEDVEELVRKLESHEELCDLHLQLECLDEDTWLVEAANRFLTHFLSHLGPKITRLHISACRIVDPVMALITEALPHLTDLALSCLHLNTYYLRKFFSGGINSKGAKLKSLKLKGLRITYRALFTIGKGARSLTDLEASHMATVDDRFLVLIADTCKHIRSVNFNGCRFVTDKGLSALASNGNLSEVRIRGTGCTDTFIYRLAAHCPQMEWIAHADFSGRPRFSQQALQFLRDTCIQRVIC